MPDCKIERRMTITRGGKLNIVTGGFTPGTETSIETRACGVPLFGDRERELGVCRSCLKGWKVDGNAPTDRGLQQIAEATAADDARPLVRFYITKPELPACLVPIARNVDWTPTLHFYGTLDLVEDDADEFADDSGALFLASDVDQADEAAAGELYRTETRH